MKHVAAFVAVLIVVLLVVGATPSFATYSLSMKVAAGNGRAIGSTISCSQFTFAALGAQQGGRPGGAPRRNRPVTFSASSTADYARTALPNGVNEVNIVLSCSAAVANKLLMGAQNQTDLQVVLTCDGAGSDASPVKRAWTLTGAQLVEVDSLTPDKTGAQPMSISFVDDAGAQVGKVSFTTSVKANQLIRFAELTFSGITDNSGGGSRALTCSSIKHVTASFDGEDGVNRTRPGNKLPQ